MTNEPDVRQRLWNWGRFKWRDLMVDAPSSSCANPMYEGMIPGGGDGYADDGDAGSSVQVSDARPEQPDIDDEDAERLGFFIDQLPKPLRTALAARYVFRAHPSTPDANAELQAAINALCESMAENRRVNDYMRRTR